MLFWPSTPTNSCAIVTQRSNTPENVVGGYLQKEANFTIVSNKGFDLDSCIAKAKSNLAKVVPKITLKMLIDFSMIHTLL